MKKLITVLFLFLSLMPIAHTGEVTGAGMEAKKILRAHNIDIQELKRNGFKLLFGEHTGAGKRMNLDRVNMVLANKKVFYLNNADHIEFKHPSQAKSLNDVMYLEYGTLKIPTGTIKAMVVK